MIEQLLTKARPPEDSLRRSVVKTISYRVVIIILDFTTIYIFTGQVKVALGFTIVSNIYTTLAYFFHERFGTK